MNEFTYDNESDLAVAPAKPAVRRPSLWQVVVLNDDFTPMDFVTMVLMEVFNMSSAKAERVMLEIHHQGRSVAGVYSHEVAKAKSKIVEHVASANGFPLLTVLERVPGPDES